LLSDYLNFFLPINDRDVNFPTFVDLNQPKQQITTLNPIPAHHRRHSLFKKVVQKSLSEDSNLSITNEPDRANQTNKIDSFLRLLIELLLNSFTDSSESLNSSYNVPNDSLERSIRKINSTPPKSLFLSNLSKSFSLTNSPVKLNDPKQYLANIETIFALSMILKHFHIFSNAFPISSQLSQRLNGNYFTFKIFFIY